jgi:membrane protease YdiL (CAAX protease family)
MDSPVPGLTRLIYVISGAAVTYGLVLRLGTIYLLGVFRGGDLTKGNIAARYTYPATLIVYLLAMAAIGFAYRPMRSVFVWDTDARPPVEGALRHVAYGLIGGLICCITAAPIMWRHGGSNVGFLVDTIADAYGASAGSFLMVLLLAVALPIASEIVFRGIVFRSLTRHVSVPAAVVASTLLFVLWWPVLGWYGSITLGVVSAMLYLRTRTLTASIVSDGVLTVGSAVLILIIAYH